MSWTMSSMQVCKVLILSQDLLFYYFLLCLWINIVMVFRVGHLTTVLNNFSNVMGKGIHLNLTDTLHVFQVEFCHSSTYSNQPQLMTMY